MVTPLAGSVLAGQAPSGDVERPTILTETAGGCERQGRRLSERRWRFIMGNGWIGQQSFVAQHEVAQAVSPRQGWLVLDAGAGDGAVSRWLVDQFDCRVLAFDPGFLPDVSGRGRSTSADASFVRGTFEEPSLWADQPYDALVSLDALQYATSPGASLAALLGAVRPHGPVLVSVWGTRSQDLADAWGFTRWTPAEVQTLARDIGLEATVSSEFRERIRRQLESLVRWGGDYVRASGTDQYLERLELETLTHAAAETKDLLQIQLRRPSGETR
jgi:SAM-dependent methyltransferase